MEAIAKLNNCPMSARKMRLVIDSIRGRNVEEALNILRYTKKEASIWLEKLVLSAVANWEQKGGNVVSADDYDLYIKTTFSNGGRQLKRFQPAPHGRAHRIRKRSNHVTIIVENRIQLDSEKEDAYVDDAVEETVED